MTEEELRGIAVDEGSYVFADEFWEDILTATSKGIMNEALDRIEKGIPNLEKTSKQPRISLIYCHADTISASRSQLTHK